MKLAIATDHRGYELKTALMADGQLSDIEWVDLGCFSSVRCDYPPYAQELSRAIQKGYVQHGILLCGSGIGMAVAANRFDGIVAGVVWHPTVARQAKEDDNVNVLVLPADYIDEATAVACIKEWMLATFKGERYQHRLDIIASWGGIK